MYQRPGVTLLIRRRGIDRTITDIAGDRLARHGWNRVERVAVNYVNQSTPEAATSSGERVIGGRYRLDATIGSGGMGTVWRAHDDVLRRAVAVKEVLLPPGLPAPDRDTLCQRTLREARAAASLSHPAVVRVYDVVQDDNRPWIVMELLEARSLADIIHAEGPLPTRTVAAVGLAVLGALEAAHRIGILHRDVKPANVMVAADGRTTLTDFGVASAPGDTSLTHTGLLLGSPQYIAPERARGRDCGPPSDLFSLGATLYAALAGTPPFDRGDPMLTLTAVVSEDPAPIPSAGQLMPVLAGLLAKDPDERFTPEQARAGLSVVLDADQIADTDAGLARRAALVAATIESNSSGPSYTFDARQPGSDRDTGQPEPGEAAAGNAHAGTAAASGMGGAAVSDDAVGRDASGGAAGAVRPRAAGRHSSGRHASDENARESSSGSANSSYPQSAPTPGGVTPAGAASSITAPDASNRDASTPDSFRPDSFRPSSSTPSSSTPSSSTSGSSTSGSSTSGSSAPNSSGPGSSAGNSSRHNASWTARARVKGADFPPPDEPPPGHHVNAGPLPRIAPTSPNAPEAHRTDQKPNPEQTHPTNETSPSDESPRAHSSHFENFHPPFSSNPPPTPDPGGGQTTAQVRHFGAAPEAPSTGATDVPTDPGANTVSPPADAIGADAANSDAGGTSERTAWSSGALTPARPDQVPSRITAPPPPGTTEPSTAGSSSGSPNNRRRQVTLVAAGVVGVVVAVVAVTSLLIANTVDLTPVQPPAAGTAATGQARNPVKLVAYRHPDGFTVQVPERWRESKGNQIRFHAPAEGVWIQLYTEKVRGSDQRAVWRSGERRQQRGVGGGTDYQRVRLSDGQLGTAKGSDWEWTYHRKGEPKRRHVLYRGAIIDGVSYQVALSAPESEFATYRPLLDRIAATFATS